MDQQTLHPKRKLTHSAALSLLRLLRHCTRLVKEAWQQAEHWTLTKNMSGAHSSLIDKNYRSRSLIAHLQNLPLSLTLAHVKKIAAHSRSQEKEKLTDFQDLESYGTTWFCVFGALILPAEALLLLFR